MIFFVDTNILIQLGESDPKYPICKQSIATLRKNKVQLFICTQVLIEYWVVATRPENVNGLGLSFEDALNNVNDFKKSFGLLPEPLNIGNIWLELISKYKVLGKTAHDTRLVAIMNHYKIENILTLNPSDFKRFDNIKTYTPDDINKIY